MKVIDRLFAPKESRGVPVFAPDEPWLYNTTYWSPNFSYPDRKTVAPDPMFEPLVRQLHDSHPVVSAAVVKRAALLSELSFQWRSVMPKDNGKLFGNAELGVLEKPNDWQTRSEFLRVVEYHASYAGNAFIHRTGADLRLLNPSWVSIVLGSNVDAQDPAVQHDADILGYLYQPGGSPQYGPPEYFLAAEVAHWRPEPDPTAWWRGRSWVQSILSEWVTDKAATAQTHAYFEHAATPNLVFSLDAAVTQENAKIYADMIAAGHSGAANAYKNLVIGGGADVTVVGADLAKLDLKNVQGLTETRIAMRAHIPAVILQISEGMQGSSLNSGNYSQTRRLWGDVWFTPTANDLCATLQTVLEVPAQSELSYDRTKVMFLQDDRKDEADILSANAIAIRQLLDAGFEADSAVEAVNTSDLTKLRHSGLFSVQLQPPGTQAPEPKTPALPPAT
jgi:phage portal protein BeeE